MTADPDTFAAAREFLQLYILGDGSNIHAPGRPVPVVAAGQAKPSGTMLLKDNKVQVLPSLPGIRRRKPAVQGAPTEFETFPKDPGTNLTVDDPTVALVDMCGLEDFLLLDGANNLSLVLFWCTDYPAQALSDEVPGLPASVLRINLPSTIEADAVALECVEKLAYLVGDNFDALALQCQIEYLQFEQLAARKAEILAAPAP